MNLLGGLGSGPIFTNPTIWALLLVTLTVGIGKFLAVRKAKTETEARNALNRSLRVVPLACRTKGHAYLQRANGWRCATCGNYVSPHEGELYGLVREGRIERRRHPR